MIMLSDVSRQVSVTSSILDTASTKFQRKLNLGLYIGWEMPELNKQIKHISSSLAI